MCKQRQTFLRLLELLIQLEKTKNKLNFFFRQDKMVDATSSLKKIKKKKNKQKRKRSQTTNRFVVCTI